MQSLAGRHHRSGKPVRKYLAATGGMIARQGLEHHVVAALGVGRSIPRAVEGDEHAVTIVARKLLLVVQRHPVGCPMRRKRRDWRDPGCARPDLLASVTTVLGREH